MQSTYNASQFSGDLNNESKRLQAQVLLSWEKEARTLKWFGLEDGMSVLEVGGGPGFFTEKLLDLLPNSLITGVEIDPILINKSEQLLKEKAAGRLNLIQGSIMNTDLPSNSFDFAIARLVFCHLPDPIGAAREILRLLKPGGKLVIIDLDIDLNVIVSPSIPELRLVQEKWKQIFAAKGCSFTLGRELWRILNNTGFEQIDLETVVCHSDDKGIESFLPQLELVLKLRVGNSNFLSPEENEAILISQKRFLASSNPFILMLWFMAVGQKPNNKFSRNLESWLIDNSSH